MTYPALSSFYLISWTYYTSFVLAESLIVFSGFDSFTNLYITWTVVTMIVCLLAWIMLYFHVRQAEVNNRKMNEYRKAAIMKKHSVSARQEEDRLLI